VLRRWDEALIAPTGQSFKRPHFILLPPKEVPRTAETDTEGPRLVRPELAVFEFPPVTREGAPEPIDLGVVTPGWQPVVARDFGPDDFRRLQEKYGISWVVLERPTAAGAALASRRDPRELPCPYANSVVMVCRVE